MLTSPLGYDCVTEHSRRGTTARWPRTDRRLDNVQHPKAVNAGVLSGTQARRAVRWGFDLTTAEGPRPSRQRRDCRPCTAMQCFPSHAGRAPGHAKQKGKQSCLYTNFSKHGEVTAVLLRDSVKHHKRPATLFAQASGFPSLNSCLPSDLESRPGHRIH